VAADNLERRLYNLSKLTNVALLSAVNLSHTGLQGDWALE